MWYLKLKKLEPNRKKKQQAGHRITSNSSSNSNSSVSKRQQQAPLSNTFYYYGYSSNSAAAAAAASWSLWAKKCVCRARCLRDFGGTFSRWWCWWLFPFSSLNPGKPSVPFSLKEFLCGILFTAFGSCFMYSKTCRHVFVCIGFANRHALYSNISQNSLTIKI